MCHYTISKYNPRTGVRIVLHQRVPEGIVGWMCRQSFLTRKEKARGFEILKESEARPVQAKIISGRTRTEKPKAVRQ